MSGRLPAWFKQKLPDPRAMHSMTTLLGQSGLHTICESALCPNAGTCFSMKTATFLILGKVCTRGCSFCAVDRGIPEDVDPGEPSRVLEAAMALSLRYVVTTSVTRDDLPDGGASQFARVIENLHGNNEHIAAEVLVPDFGGSQAALERVVESKPEVVGHNVETVPRLYSEVRRGASYDRSLELLSAAKRFNPYAVTKSGLMVGLGETRAEVIGVLHDLRDALCDIVTIGQYLQPSPQHHPVREYVTPGEFAEYGELARGMGFASVASDPLVRSSYRAADLYAGGRDAAGWPAADGRSGETQAGRAHSRDEVLEDAPG